MDINRTLTDNIFFRKGPGVHKLEQVLIAYSRRNPAVGYCQGMNMIAASLLLIMPTEEDAFWVLVSIVENILPKTYFEPSLLASRADQIVGLFVPAARPHTKVPNRCSTSMSGRYYHTSTPTCTGWGLYWKPLPFSGF